jgi:hypothetical protein
MLKISEYFDLFSLSAASKNYWRYVSELFVPNSDLVQFKKIKTNLKRHDLKKELYDIIGKQIRHENQRLKKQSKVDPK